MSVLFLASLGSSPFWGIRVWDSDDTSICNSSVSLILYHGACTENSYGGSSTSSCTDFSDTSVWDSADDYLNGVTSTNTQDANMSAGASDYQSIGKIMHAALAIGVVAVVCQIASAYIPSQEMYKTLQVANTVIVALAGILIISGLGKSHNDLTDVTYWELLYCGTGIANTTTANSTITAPLGGYFLALIALLCNIISGSILLVPGNCCFCCPCEKNCGCCFIKPEDTSLMAGLQPSSGSITSDAVSSHNPTNGAAPVVVGKVVDYA